MVISKQDSVRWLIFVGAMAGYIESQLSRCAATIDPPATQPVR